MEPASEAVATPLRDRWRTMLRGAFQGDGNASPVACRPGTWMHAKSPVERATPCRRFIRTFRSNAEPDARRQRVQITEPAFRSLLDTVVNRDVGSAGNLATPRCSRDARATGRVEAFLGWRRPRSEARLGRRRGTVARGVSAAPFSSARRCLRKIARFVREALDTLKPCRGACRSGRMQAFPAGARDLRSKGLRESRRSRSPARAAGSGVPCRHGDESRSRRRGAARTPAHSYRRSRAGDVDERALRRSRRIRRRGRRPDRGDVVTFRPSAAESARVSTLSSRREAHRRRCRRRRQGIARALRHGRPGRATRKVERAKARAFGGELPPSR